MIRKRHSGKFANKYKECAAIIHLKTQTQDKTKPFNNPLRYCMLKEIPKNDDACKLKSNKYVVGGLNKSTI